MTILSFILEIFLRFPLDFLRGSLSQFYLNVSSSYLKVHRETSFAVASEISDGANTGILLEFFFLKVRPGISLIALIKIVVTLFSEFLPRFLSAATYGNFSLRILSGIISKCLCVDFLPAFKGNYCKKTQKKHQEEM